MASWGGGASGSGSGSWNRAGGVGSSGSGGVGSSGSGGGGSSGSGGRGSGSQQGGKGCGGRAPAQVPLDPKGPAGSKRRGGWSSGSSKRLKSDQAPELHPEDLPLGAALRMFGRDKLRPREEWVLMPWLGPMN